MGREICMSLDTIRQLTLNSFEKVFNRKLNEQDWTSHFFGFDINLESRDFIYFIFQLEEDFKIKFDETDLLGENIFSINELSKLIFSKLN